MVRRALRDGVVVKARGAASESLSAECTVSLDASSARARDVSTNLVVAQE
ncbi:hypothetical protein IG631_09765 [Alternaria alternata]|nr:hypothetical protein IG631_09765 [Alternaria alternata]